jgi:predicted RNA binding protein YcfA (HicA-like mRNA interferase family)
MTRLPRNLSGDELARALRKVGYVPVRQTGSHLRLTTQTMGEHHVSIPRHAELRVGTLAGVLGDVSEHLRMSRDALVDQLFG